MSAESAQSTESVGSPPMGGHTRTEYGVIVDLTDIGHGYRLAEVSHSRAVAEASAEHYRALHSRPVEVKARSVHVTDWQPLLTSPGMTGDPA